MISDLCATKQEQAFDLIVSFRKALIFLISIRYISISSFPLKVKTDENVSYAWL